MSRKLAYEIRLTGLRGVDIEALSLQHFSDRLAERSNYDDGLPTSNVPSNNAPMN